MSTADELTVVEGWLRPPVAQCARENYTSPLRGADRAKDYLAIRWLRDQTTFMIVEFSLIQLTKYHGRWVEVAEIDSCHDANVHLHQCGRDAGGRIGDPVSLHDLDSLESVQDGYEVGLAHMTDQWAILKQRWHYN